MFDGTLKELIEIIQKALRSVKKRIWLFFKTTLFWLFALAPLIGALALVPIVSKYTFVSIIIILLIWLEIPWGNAIKDLVHVHK